MYITWQECTIAIGTVLALTEVDIFSRSAFNHQITSKWKRKSPFPDCLTSCWKHFAHSHPCREKPVQQKVWILPRSFCFYLARERAWLGPLHNCEALRFENKLSTFFCRHHCGGFFFIAYSPGSGSIPHPSLNSSIASGLTSLQTIQTHSQVCFFQVIYCLAIFQGGYL